MQHSHTLTHNPFQPAMHSHTQEHPACSRLAVTILCEGVHAAGMNHTSSFCNGRQAIDAELSTAAMTTSPLHALAHRSMFVGPRALMDTAMGTLPNPLAKLDLLPGNEACCWRETLWTLRRHLTAVKHVCFSADLFLSEGKRERWCRVHGTRTSPWPIDALQTVPDRTFNLPVMEKFSSSLRLNRFISESEKPICLRSRSSTVFRCEMRETP